MKKNRLLVVLIMAMPFAVAAQGDIGELFNGNVADAKYLSEGYISPLMKSIGYGLNQGWVNTAKPHKIAGFDLTLSINPVFTPSSDKIFTVDNSKMSSIYLATDMDGKQVSQTGTGNIPTVLGADDKTTQFREKPLGVGGFNGPDGIGIGFVPMPTANLGFGLPKGFDLKVRFIPTLKIGSGDDAGKIGLWGIGVMHDFKQWIPGIKALPFDLSAFVGYTSMKLETKIDEGGPDGKGAFTSSATTIQIIISKKLSVFTPYASVGMNMATTKLNVNGTYSFDDGTTVKDPISLSVTANGPRATGGFRLKFGPIALHADATLAKYKSASVGFGINVR
jgi:hypothetical protein